MSCTQFFFSYRHYRDFVYSTANIFDRDKILLTIPNLLRKHLKVKRQTRKFHEHNNLLLVVTSESPIRERPSFHREHRIKCDLGETNDTCRKILQQSYTHVCFKDAHSQDTLLFETCKEFASSQ